MNTTSPLKSTDNSYVVIIIVNIIAWLNMSEINLISCKILTCKSNY